MLKITINLLVDRAKDVKQSLNMVIVNLTSVDTLPGYNMSDNKFVISGTVYKLDGKTPAPNVIMYFYQTDENGIYVKQGDEARLGKTSWIYSWLGKNR